MTCEFIERLLRDNPSVDDVAAVAWDEFLKRAPANVSLPAFEDLTDDEYNGWVRVVSIIIEASREGQDQWN